LKSQRTLRPQPRSRRGFFFGLPIVHILRGLGHAGPTADRDRGAPGENSPPWGHRRDSIVQCFTLNARRQLRGPWGRPRQRGGTAMSGRRCSRPMTRAAGLAIEASAPRPLFRLAAALASARSDALSGQRTFQCRTSSAATTSVAYPERAAVVPEQAAGIFSFGVGNSARRFLQRQRRPR
jgi:hypothetical protein